MKLSEILNKSDPTPAPAPAPAPVVPDLLIDLATKAIEAVDAEREAKARASLARRDLEAALDAAKLDSCEALGRTIKFKVGSNPDPTLKNLKVILGDVEAKKLWDQIPRKLYRSLDIPKAADGGPEVE